MLGAIASGPSVIHRPLRGEDCASTLRCLIEMGLRHEPIGDDSIRLVPAHDWAEPRSALDCGNSGTTMRLLAGLIASRPIKATLIGDTSLSRRPMARVAEPLRLMGATVQGERAPLEIMGTHLHGIDYGTPVSSAQIKSCVLLAGLRAAGETRVTEPSPSRDHTERMLAATGATIAKPNATTTVLAGGESLVPFEFAVPGDISSAAFWLCAAAMLPSSVLMLANVGVNPTRTGVLEVLAQAGQRVETENQRHELGEPVADLHMESSSALNAFQIGGDLVPRLVDEIPVLAVLATQCEGVSTIRDAAELRVKESDRIEAVANGLRSMGAKVEAHTDGLTIAGPTPLRGANIDAAGDHRLAMAFAVAGLVADGKTVIENAESVLTSYPEFEKDLRSVTHV